MSYITKGEPFRLPILFHCLRLYEQKTAEKPLPFLEMSLLLSRLVPTAKSTITQEVLQFKLLRGWQNTTGEMKL